MFPANSANTDDHVLVIGAAGIDVKGRPHTLLPHATTTSGTIRFGLGGVARNIAENLARLEVPTILLTAVGEGHNGQFVIDGCAQAGIDTQYIVRIPREHTGSTIFLMTHDNDLASGISDFGVIKHITPDWLNSHRSLFATASMVVIDASLSQDAIAAIFDLTAEFNVPVCADPTSAAHASKLCDYLPKLYLVAPNSAETTALCGLPLHAHDIDSAVQGARHLVTMGVQVAIITLGDQGLAYANSSSSGYIPALRTRVIDATGAGDALTAAVIFGLLNEVPLDEAMRLGVTAASLTLRSRHSVVPELNQELLYDELVI
ncbi:MAG: carbohydrate kinase family protein [Anaerolineae bacterium]|nr:carbohydrate kinase family protein [Anaerolineae bacterium]